MQLGRNRIEALTDGVFAVAMTLLVLDIKVPELQQPLATAGLPLKLLSLWPKFLSYTISFVILGVYWVGHHVQLSFIRRADRPLLWINILFLLWVALVPFSTALLSEYATTRIAIAIYGANLIAIGLTLALHWWYATTENRHVDPDIDRGLVRGAMYRTLMGPLVYVIAIGLSFFRAEVSLALYALVPILYILPGRIDIHWVRRRQGKSKMDQAAVK
jgi:TMEM175 potassium channel family protein